MTQFAHESNISSVPIPRRSVTRANLVTHQNPHQSGGFLLQERVSCWWHQPSPFQPRRWLQQRFRPVGTAGLIPSKVDPPASGATPLVAFRPTSDIRLSCNSNIACRSPSPNENSSRKFRISFSKPVCFL